MTRTTTCSRYFVAIKCTTSTPASMTAHPLVGDWLEAGSRRRLPRSRLAHAPGCFRGLWCADAGHDRHHHGYVQRAPNHSWPELELIVLSALPRDLSTRLCYVGFSLSGQPRQFDDRHGGAACRHGVRHHPIPPFGGFEHSLVCMSLGVALIVCSFLCDAECSTATSRAAPTRCSRACTGSAVRCWRCSCIPAWRLASSWSSTSSFRASTLLVPPPPTAHHRPPACASRPSPHIVSANERAT